MQEPYHLNYRTPIISNSEVTKAVARHTHIPISFAEARLIDFGYGHCLVQTYAHHLFYIEYSEFDLQKDLDIEVTIHEKQVLLSFQLEGSTRFLFEGGSMIKESEAKSFFLYYADQSCYVAKLKKGKHTLLSVSIKTDWLKTVIDTFPSLKISLENFLNNRFRTLALPPTQLNTRILALLKRIQDINNNGKAHLEARLHVVIVDILEHYNNSLKLEQEEIAHMAKKYIDRNFTQPGLNIAKIADLLCCTSKTLIGSFKQKYNTTPYLYLIMLRMALAHQLLGKGHAPIKEIHWRVGYNDVQSFRIQFKKHFGYPPRQTPEQ